MKTFNVLLKSVFPWVGGVVFFAASVNADILIRPGDSIWVGNDRVTCQAVFDCRSDADCASGQQCSANRCVPRQVQVYSSSAKCVPVDPNYDILQNTLVLITEMRDGTMKTTDVGVYQTRTECQAQTQKLPAFHGSEPVRSRLCVPVDPNYGILQNTLIQVTQLPEGPVNRVEIGTYQTRSECESQLVN